MFGFLTPARRESAGPLANVGEVDHFWRSLPRNDPLNAQKSICEALADIVLEKNLSRDELRALLALDQRARALGGALLVNYGARSASSKPFERRYWRAAIELSRAFATTLEYFLRYMRNEPAARNWRQYAPAVVLRMFRHRQVEFLLRPFINDAPIPETWAELHSTYQFVESQGWAHHQISDQGEREVDPPSTLQKEYIHILLLDLMNGGQFSPYDAFWLSRWVPHWTHTVALHVSLADGSAEGDHFVVDLDSAEGLKRVSAGPLGHARYIDAKPLLASIESEIESLRDPLNPVRIPSSFGSPAQVKLLRKAANSYSPQPPRVNRRGERKPASTPVKAVVGLGHIVKMLRYEEKKKPTAAPLPAAEVEEITITVTGGYTQSSVESVNTEVPNGGPSAHEFGVPHHLWQLKDKSASGCRFRAPGQDASRVVPGTLVAIRDDESMGWSLVVVRRLKTRIGDRVDIGVEYVGHNPRGVTMAFEASDPETQESRKQTSGVFTALYLRESAKQPVMPFKTLIMSTGTSMGTGSLTLRSANAEYTVRLKEPIEEQDDFVWLPYEVLDRRAGETVVPEMAPAGAIPLQFPPQMDAPPGESPTDWLIQQTRNRAENAA